MIAYGVFMLLQAPLWPAYGEAIRRGDLPWARRTLRLMLTLGVGGMFVCGAGLLTFLEPVVRLMTGGADVYVSRHLVVAVMAFFVMRAWTECQSVPLNSAGIVRPQLLLLLSNGVLNVVLALVLVGPYGVLGVAWAFPIAAAVTSLWGYPVLIRRYLGAIRPGGAAAPPAAAARGAA
jgi:O-antigen/teichoic acid export membrane protein